jgi:hypothetical protein
MTPSEATDWIVAVLAAYPSVAREEFINTLMVEILLPACMAPVLASLECKYCILKAAVYLLHGMLLSDDCIKGRHVMSAV